jgi:hypothetical protein
MKSGAGRGAGLTGAGSQNLGETSTGTVKPGSGSVTAVATDTTSTATKESAGTSLQPMDKSPMIIGLTVVAFSLLGATLL